MIVLIGVSAWCWVADVVQRATAALPRVIERFLEKAAVSLNLHLPSLPQLLPVHTQQQSVASVLTIGSGHRNGEHVRPDRIVAGRHMLHVPPTSSLPQ